MKDGEISEAHSPGTFARGPGRHGKMCEAGERVCSCPGWRAGWGNHLEDREHRVLLEREGVAQVELRAREALRHHIDAAPRRVDHARRRARHRRPAGRRGRWRRCRRCRCRRCCRCRRRMREAAVDHRRVVGLGVGEAVKEVVGLGAARAVWARLLRVRRGRARRRRRASVRIVLRRVVVVAFEVGGRRLYPNVLGEPVAAAAAAATLATLATAAAAAAAAALPPRRRRHPKVLLERPHARRLDHLALGHLDVHQLGHGRAQRAEAPLRARRRRVGLACALLRRRELLGAALLHARLKLELCDVIARRVGRHGGKA